MPYQGKFYRPLEKTKPIKCRVVESSLKGCFYNKAPIPKAQGSLHRRVQKECKSQRNNREFLVSVSSRNVRSYTHKV